MKLRFILYLYLLLVWLHVCPVVSASSCVFTPIDATQGLSGNKVRSIAQLPDGRMMIMTEGQLNLFDGTDFSYLHYGREHFCPLSEYSGYHHTYIDGNGYMWIKNQYQLMVLDIDSQKFVVNPETLPVQWGIKGGLKDLFMDRDRNLWVITGGDSLYCVDGKTHKARFSGGGYHWTGTRSMIWGWWMTDFISFTGPVCWSVMTSIRDEKFTGRDIRKISHPGCMGRHRM